jgi:RNase P/RNase MRP subunit p30
MALDKIEQEKICRAIAVTGMWGHGWVPDSLFRNFEEHGVEVERPWREVFNEVQKGAERQAVGVLDDEERLIRYLAEGYRLTNYGEDGYELFNPPPMNGLCMYVSKELSEKMKAQSARTEEIARAVAKHMWTDMAAAQQAALSKLQKGEK